jgi:hypothetical protein
VHDQSTSWQFPEEIPALKSLLSQKADISSSASITSHVYVSLPKPLENKETLPLAEITPSFEERVQLLKERSLQQTPTVPDESLNTNYTRSLDEIKQEYSHWLRYQKGKSISTRFIRPLAIVAVLLSVTLGSFWLAQSFFSKTRVEGSDIVKVEPNQKTAPFDKSEENVNASETEVQSGSTTASEPASSAVLRTSKKKLDVKKSNKKILEQPAIVSVAVKSTLSTTPTETINEPSESIAKQIHLKAEYVESGKQQGVGGLNVVLSNKSKQVLKVVAVDVIYFKDLDNEFQRKTLYFNNVAPGATLTLQAPANQQAQGAYARLGLISSEGGSIFYARN